jgi:hypothetical protein
MSSSDGLTSFALEEVATSYCVSLLHVLAVYHAITSDARQWIQMECQQQQHPSREHDEANDDVAASEASPARFVIVRVMIHGIVDPI